MVNTKRASHQYASIVIISMLACLCDHLAQVQPHERGCRLLTSVIDESC